jgi:putative mRNA 3-end processing factor
LTTSGFRGGLGHDGAVLLGDVVCCDGFRKDVPVRVQTHVHHDHLADFSRSKGIQDIVLTPESYQLLIAMFNADLPYRENMNIFPLPFNTGFSRKGHVIDLAPTGHMLGCAQVRVTMPDGYRISYSSDFSWPTPQPVLECDELVVDSTYGDPAAVRNYTREEVKDRLLSLVERKVAEGPVLFFGHRGRIQYAMEFLGNSLRDIPVVASPAHLPFAQVYEQFGHSLRTPISCESAEAIYLRVRRKPSLFFYAWNEFEYAEPREGTYSVTLSAYAVPREDPILEYNEDSCRVALTDHADYNGTLDFVRASKAKRVLTDSSRGGNAEALAKAITSVLGVDSQPLYRSTSREWGK